MKLEKMQDEALVKLFKAYRHLEKHYKALEERYKAVGASVEAALAGAEAAKAVDEAWEVVGVLYARHYDFVRRFANRKLAGNWPMDAEDMTQEVFTLVWDKLTSFGSKDDESKDDKPKAKLKTWLAGITKNLVLGIKGKYARELTLPEGEEELHDVLGKLGVSPPTAAPTIVMREVIDLLSEKESRLLILLCSSGCSYEEIAFILGIPVERVRWRLHAIRKRLRELFKAKQLLANLET